MSYKVLILALFLIATPLDSANAFFGKDKAKTTPLSSHQPIKAEVINDNPNKFTIDVKDFENVDANEEAKTFALYTSEDEPKTCGDFTDLDLDYEKPEKHKRVFDLSEHKEILAALKKYNCVAVKNKS